MRKISSASTKIKAPASADLAPVGPATAGVVRRLSAMVYDSLLMFGVLFTATLPTLLFKPKQLAAINNEQVVHELPTLAEGWPFQVYLLLVYCGFFLLVLA